MNGENFQSLVCFEINNKDIRDPLLSGMLYVIVYYPVLQTLSF